MRKLEKHYAGINLQESLGMHYIDINGYFTGIFNDERDQANRQDQVIFTLFSMVSILDKIAFFNNLNIRFKIERG